MDNDADLIYDIALSLLPNVGCARARQILHIFGNSRSMFEAGERNLQKIHVPGVVGNLYTLIRENEVLKRAGEEMDFIRNNALYVCSVADERYPRRLKQCVDAPFVLYGRGRLPFETIHSVALVGTRKVTAYGRQFCDELVAQMSCSKDYLVISGLAYGTDVAAHRASIRYAVPTIGVLAHGLERIYPESHRSVAERMLADGGLVSDFPHHTELLPANFVRRNRIIAGLADATIVVESGVKGGALLTADMAISYHRDVFAVPGYRDAPYSRGCNALIKQNKACLIESLADLEYQMNWNPSKFRSSSPVQRSLFVDLSAEERKIVKTLEDGPRMIDEISSTLQLPGSRVSALLLAIEFKGMVVSLPGKIYRLP